MKSILKSIIVFVFFLYSSILSQESDSTESQTESWYFFIAFGYPVEFLYPSYVQETLDSHIKQLSNSESRLILELGVYIHITTKTIGGVIFDGATNVFRTGNDASFDITQHTYGLSVLHFFERDFGSGLFIRADLGLARIYGDRVLEIPKPGQFVTEYSFDPNGKGIGILLGGGWSLNFGATRLLLTTNYTYRGADSGTFHTFGLSVGGLF